MGNLLIKIGENKQIYNNDKNSQINIVTLTSTIS